jgi:L-fucose mutarotase/ribose pyranase (RbsD/FucU family)
VIRGTWHALAGLFLLMLTGISTGQPERDWRTIVIERLPEYGHRNWIVIADAAFPALNRAGIEVVVTEADHLRVLRFVIEEISELKHVRPIIHLEAELPHIAERDVRGVTRYRRELNNTLRDFKSQSAPHVELVDLIEKAAANYKILVLKTNLLMPYSSVYLELNRADWSPEAEQRLRELLNADKK